MSGRGIGPVHVVPVTRANARRLLDRGVGDVLAAVARDAIDSSPTAEDDEWVALAAVVDGEAAGRVLFTYGYATDYGKPFRIAAAQSLRVEPPFRGQGLARRLIEATRGLAVPCLYSGMSEQALPLYRRLGFSFIDESPIFRFPLRPGAILRTWRNYREEHAATTTERRRGALLRAFDAARGRWLAGDRLWRIVEPARAAEALAHLNAVPCGRFEVPRDLARIAASLTAERDGLWSVVLEPNDGSSRRVATVYVRTERVRLPLSRRYLHFRDGHVSEIFPPMTDVAAAIGVVRALLAEAVRRGLGCLSVHAMTTALRRACAALGAERRWARTIAIHPGAAPPSVAEALVDPTSWWCRAFCEEQIEETGSMGPRSSAAVRDGGPMLACVAGREAPEQP